MKTSNRFFAVPFTVMLVVHTGFSQAQPRAEEAGGASMAALIVEIRQLRAAIEESTKHQSQAQALAIYLSAQQSRMVQLATRLDAVRNELA
jgi:hypothetical protein